MKTNILPMLIVVLTAAVIVSSVIAITISAGVLGLVGYLVSVGLGGYILDSLNLSQIWEK
jgi:hypothetical protein